MHTYISPPSPSLFPFPQVDLKLGEPAISIDDISRLTCITPIDIIDTLKSLKVLVWYKGKWVFSLTNLESYFEEKERKRKLKPPVDPKAIWVADCRPEKLHWVPFFVNKRAK